MDGHIHDQDLEVRPIKVQIVNEQRAPVERRSNMQSFNPSTQPQSICPQSDRRIRVVINVVATNQAQAGVVYLCKDQAAALGVVAAFTNGGSFTSGGASVIGAGTFELVGTGDIWMVSTGPSNYTVGVIAEYES